jgi:hypothetical protein
MIWYSDIQTCGKPATSFGPFSAIFMQLFNKEKYIIWLFISKMCGPGSSVGITTGYVLDGTGIESRWGSRFSTLVQTGPGAHSASCTMGTGSFPGVKDRPGRDANPSPPSSAVGHERVELYLYSPYGPYSLYRASVPVQGCTLPFITKMCNNTFKIKHTKMAKIFKMYSKKCISHILVSWKRTFLQHFFFVFRDVSWKYRNSEVYLTLNLLAPTTVGAHINP